jgi:hypothetical protein
MQLCGLQAKRSSGQKGETPAASLYGFMFYAVLYTVFKKVIGFYTVSYGFLPFQLSKVRFYLDLFPYPETAESTSFDNVRACLPENFWENSA